MGLGVNAMARDGDITDNTPLDGDRIDLGARIGWLLRVNREARGLGQRQLAVRLAELGVENSSFPVLSRMESGGLRRRRLIEGYERVLELQPGSLVSAVQMLCENSPYAPRDGDSKESMPSTLDLLDRVCEPLMAAIPSAPRTITGGQWMEFGRVSRGTGLLLPTSLARPILSELIHQLGMSVEAAFRTRYLALQDLYRTGYADLIESLVIEYVDQPGCAVMNDLLAAAGEMPSARLFEWLLGLLGGPDPVRARAASLALETVAALEWAGSQEWRRVAEIVVRVYPDPATPPARREGLARLATHLPAVHQCWITASLGAAVSPTRSPISWEPTRRHNAHLNFAHQLARLGCDAAGVEEQPMAQRLVFEMLYDPRSSRAFTSTMLLGSSPLGPGLVRGCISLGINRAPDPVTRSGCIEAMVGLHGDWKADELEPILRSVDPAAQSRLLISAGHRGVELPEDLIRGFLADPLLRRDAFYYLGFAGHPMLDDLTHAADPDVAVSARWWRAQAPRVTE